MKNKLFILALIAFISSCTVVKRVHQPGYYVSWHKQHKVIPSSDEQLLVQNKIESTEEEKNNLAAENVLPTTEDSQYFQQSDEAVNISSSETKSVVSTQIKQHANITPTKHVKSYKIIKKHEGKKASNSASSEGGKSQVVALVLAILLGGIGIHRFYLGHIGMGILYLFTAGLCGIGWLIDIILIATGSLEPKDGGYDKTL